MPRTAEWRDVSQVGAASLTQIFKRFVGQGVQPAGGGIGLDLLVPEGRVELGKPRAKRRQLIGRKPPHGSLNFLDGAHGNWWSRDRTWIH